MVVMKLHVKCKDGWLVLEFRGILLYGCRHYPGFQEEHHARGHGTIEQENSPNGIRVKEKKGF